MLMQVPLDTERQAGLWHRSMMPLSFPRLNAHGRRIVEIAYVDFGDRTQYFETKAIQRAYLGLYHRPGRT